MRPAFQILNRALIVHRGASFCFTGTKPGEAKTARRLGWSLFDRFLFGARSDFEELSAVSQKTDPIAV
jgi:hypothetical protein